MAFCDQFEHEPSRQTQAWKESCEAVRRGRHALRCLLRYRDTGTEAAATLVASHSRALCKALQPTRFGQAFDAEIAERLLSVAEHVELGAGTVIKEDNDLTESLTLTLSEAEAGLYMVLSGTVEVLRTEPMDQKGGGRRLRVSIHSAALKADEIDPELKFACTLQLGKQLMQTPWVSRGEEDVEWHFIGSLPYDGDKLEFTLQGCKDNDGGEGITLGSGTLEAPIGKTSFEGDVSLRTFPSDPSAESSFVGSLQVSFSSVIDRVRTISDDDNYGRKTGRNTSGLIPGLDLLDLDESLHGAKSSQRPSQKLKYAKAASRMATGQVFGPGDCFRPSGCAVICSSDCEFLRVKHVHLVEALRCAADERNSNRDAFLRTWLPGVDNVDPKAWETFCSTFQLMSFPKNHVFCTAGCHGESRRAESPRRKGEANIFVVVEGECRIVAPQEQAEGTCGIDAVQRVVPPREQVGIVGEGQLLGFSSGLFATPEPFTAIAASGVKAYVWSGSGERAAAGWPRELLKPLAGNLKMRVAQHRTREGHLTASGQSSISKSNQASSSSSALSTLVDSPFLRNKDTSKSWKVKALQDHCAGWSPAQANRRPPSPSPSMPSLPQLNLDGGRRQRGSLPQITEVRPRRLPNLKNPTDWSLMTTVTSRSAMMKMYKQRVRLGSNTVQEAGRSVVDFARTTEFQRALSLHS